MTGSSRIALGTVQFGSDYGITNRVGRLKAETVNDILRMCAVLDVDMADTARLYGDSEAVLGRAPLARKLRIVTKTPKFSEIGSRTEASTFLRTSFEESLRYLCRDSVYGLLLHDADDLLGPYGEALWREMRSLRVAGSAQRIGVSVYEGAQVDALLERYDLDLVQLPLSPLDRRLVDGGQLTRLAARGVEVHGRSLFLQGLLLEDPERVPEWLGPVRAGVTDLHGRFAAVGMGRAEGIFAWMNSLPIDRFVCGFTSAAELQDIALAEKKAQRHASSIDLAGAPIIDPVYLNPAKWRGLAGAEADTPGRV